MNGHNIAKDPETIHRLVGYCPQFDALFETLTGREHLRLYAAIKVCFIDARVALPKIMFFYLFVVFVSIFHGVLYNCFGYVKAFVQRLSQDCDLSPPPT